MLKIEIISPEKVVHQTEGVEVIIPTSEGEIGVRSGHLPLLAPLIAGAVIVKKADGKEESLATIGGFVEVLDDTISIMIDEAEFATNLDELKIQEAIHRAEELKKNTKDTGELRTAKAMLASNLSRLKTLRRHRRNH